MKWYLKCAWHREHTINVRYYYCCRKFINRGAPLFGLLWKGKAKGLVEDGPEVETVGFSLTHSPTRSYRQGLRRANPVTAFCAPLLLWPSFTNAKSNGNQHTTNNHKSNCYCWVYLHLGSVFRGRGFLPQPQEMTHHWLPTDCEFSNLWILTGMFGPLYLMHLLILLWFCFSLPSCYFIFLSLICYLLSFLPFLPP